MGTPGEGVAGVRRSVDGKVMLRVGGIFGPAPGGIVLLLLKSGEDGLDAAHRLRHRRVSPAGVR